MILFNSNHQLLPLVVNKISSFAENTNLCVTSYSHSLPTCLLEQLILTGQHDDALLYTLISVQFTGSIGLRMRQCNDVALRTADSQGCGPCDVTQVAKLSDGKLKKEEESTSLTLLRGLEPVKVHIKVSSRDYFVKTNSLAISTLVRV